MQHRKRMLATALAVISTLTVSMAMLNPVAASAADIEITIDGGGGGAVTGGEGGNIEIGVAPGVKPPVSKPPASNSSTNSSAASTPPAASSSSETSAPPASSSSSSSSETAEASSSSSSSEAAEESSSEDSAPATPEELGELAGLTVYSDTGLMLPLLKTSLIQLTSDKTYAANQIQKIFGK